MNASTSEESYMQRCLELAQKGAGRVAPNPLVGAVLVHADRIIGEGWHNCYGEAHAEVNCIRSVAPEDFPLIENSRLFVSLEPCAHFGQTPPCTDLILQHRIPEVIIGCADTFSQVAGKGIRRLREAGVQVKTGILQEACRLMNRRFFTRQEQGRPYLILKWAESPDGFMAATEGGPTLISGKTSLKLVHKMRQQEDAFLIGYQTALLDNPLLTDRHWGGPQPVKIVIDPDNGLPEHLNVMQRGITYILNRAFDQSTGNVHRIKMETVLPTPIWFSKEKTGKLNSVVVEGGGKTLRQFIKAGLWDEAWIFTGKKALGKGLTAPRLKHARLQQTFNLGEDIVSLWVHDRNEFYL